MKGFWYVEISHLTSKIHRFYIFGASAYLIEKNGYLVAIDTGWLGGGKIILHKIKKMGFSPKDLKTIILTHGHPDHIGGLYTLKKETGAKVAAHVKEIPYIELQNSYIRGVVKLGKYVAMIKPVKVDIPLKEGDIIEGLKVIHTPGHTEGSICLYDEENKILFSGDALQVKFNQFALPPWYYNHNVEDTLKSAIKIGELDFDILYPGNGGYIIGNASQKVKNFLKVLNVYRNNRIHRKNS